MQTAWHSSYHDQEYTSLRIRLMLAACSKYQIVRSNSRNWEYARDSWYQSLFAEFAYEDPVWLSHLWLMVFFDYFPQLCVISKSVSEKSGVAMRKFKMEFHFRKVH